MENSFLVYQHNWLLYIAVFACAFAVSLFATPYAKTIAIKLGAIDYPKKRGMHKKPVPRMGGIAIFLGFILSMLIIAPFASELREKEFFGFIIGGIIIFVLGAIDDIKNLNAKTKLAVQIVVGLIVIFSGTEIDVVFFPMLTNLGILSKPFTLFWIIGITNAINLIDGLDGLAAGVSSIGALCLMVLCILTGTQVAVILTAALAGSCLGFLPRNFNPADIIMGDSGSTFLGYVLAVSSIMGVFKTYLALAVVLACLALALPIFDTLFAMLRRAINGQPVMQADRGHIHHRLIDSGWTHKQAVLIIYGISFASALFSITLALKNYFASTITLIATVVLTVIVFIYKKRVSVDSKSE